MDGTLPAPLDRRRRREPDPGGPRETGAGGDRGPLRDLLLQNRPDRFWRLVDDLPADAWEMAARDAQRAVFGAREPLPVDAFLEWSLGEGQFGPRRYSLSRPKRLYYSAIRPLLPRALRPLVRSAWRRHAARGFQLGWPVEDRYARFQRAALLCALRRADREATAMRWFWPDRLPFAVCLTHDVEGDAGQRFVPELAALEERYGFRSSFNFVARAYAVDRALLEELRRRGFEVGVHGDTHTGRKFFSRAAFAAAAPRINATAHAWGAVGFRSPLMLRQPEWMQALDIEYDLSFFDSDPYEPMPGGTMSIWPFRLGRFVELPTTLPQDHTIFELGERTARVWREKVEFIRAYHGLALVNVHPDYMRDPRRLAVYEELLAWLSDLRAWRALPRDVAARWSERLEPDGLADERPVGVAIEAGALAFALD